LEFVGFPFRRIKNTPGPESSQAQPTPERFKSGKITPSLRSLRAAPIAPRVTPQCHTLPRSIACRSRALPALHGSAEDAIAWSPTAASQSAGSGC